MACRTASTDRYRDASARVEAPAAGAAADGEAAAKDANKDSRLPPLPPSAIPENIPEHLKLPPEWVDGHYALDSDAKGGYPFSPEESQRLLNIFKEIVSDYNPQRPLAAVGKRYIDHEKIYRAHAEHELGYTPLGTGSYNRIDWQYEQVWAHPEVWALVFQDAPPGEEHYFTTTRSIAMGEESPDWNLTTLQDGREFRMKDPQVPV